MVRLAVRSSRWAAVEWGHRTGQRDKGEEFYAKALARNPDDVWHYVRAAEAYLGAPRGR